MSERPTDAALRDFERLLTEVLAEQESRGHDPVTSRAFALGAGKALGTDALRNLLVGTVGLGFLAGLVPVLPVVAGAVALRAWMKGVGVTDVSRALSADADAREALAAAERIRRARETFAGLQDLRAREPALVDAATREMFEALVEGRELLG